MLMLQSDFACEEIIEGYAFNLSELTEMNVLINSYKTGESELSGITDPRSGLEVHHNLTRK